jgi:hypothetical protein
MKAILIDPWEKSLATIQIKDAKPDVHSQLEQLYNLVGEEGLDFAYVLPGESIAVGDHSAQQNPPFPSYSLEGYSERLYGRGVVIGFKPNGEECETKLTVDDISRIITWYPGL